MYVWAPHECLVPTEVSNPLGLESQTAVGHTQVQEMEHAPLGEKLDIALNPKATSPALGLYL